MTLGGGYMKFSMFKNILTILKKKKEEINCTVVWSLSVSGRSQPFETLIRFRALRS